MKIKKSSLLIIVLMSIAIAIFYFYNSQPIDSYSFRDDKFSYSENRGKPDYQISLTNSTATLNIYAINFQSRNFMQYPTRIYALLFMPKEGKDFPGIIYLPGGGMKKEQRVPLVSKLAEKGYAVLIIDQRGIGQTEGYYLNFEEDYQIFSQGKEPIQHLSVYDVLKSFDVLRSIDKVGKNNIVVAGESMGGRYAIIAAALDKKIKGLVVISSSGFDVKKDSQPYNSYLLSIDPDSYIEKISPRDVVMFHSINDSVVQLQVAQHTFSLAKEPKEFFVYDNETCQHGYCPAMQENLEKTLKKIFEK